MDVGGAMRTRSLKPLSRRSKQIHRGIKSVRRTCSFIFRHRGVGTNRAMVSVVRVPKHGVSSGEISYGY
jgi:hypothetical protein